MPKRTDIHSVLIIGAGPIIIGQACEFDYSGTQACKALREEGYRVILVNSNPATIMTDPEFADLILPAIKGIKVIPAKKRIICPLCFWKKIFFLKKIKIIERIIIKVPITIFGKL